MVSSFSILPKHFFNPCSVTPTDRISPVTKLILKFFLFSDWIYSNPFQDSLAYIFLPSIVDKKNNRYIGDSSESVLFNGKHYRLQQIILSSPTLSSYFSLILRILPMAYFILSGSEVFPILMIYGTMLLSKWLFRYDLPLTPQPEFDSSFHKKALHPTYISKDGEIQHDIYK